MPLSVGSVHAQVSVSVNTARSEIFLVIQHMQRHRHRWAFSEAREGVARRAGQVGRMLLKPGAPLISSLSLSLSVSLSLAVSLSLLFPPYEISYGPSPSSTKN